MSNKICSYCNIKCKNLEKHLKKCKSVYRKDTDILEDIIERLHKKYESLKIKNINEIENLKKEHKEEVIELNRNLNIYKENIEELEERINIDNNNEDIETFHEEILKLKEDIEKLKDTITKKTEDYEEQLITILQLNEHIEKLESDINSKTEDYEEQKVNIVQLNEHIEKLESDINGKTEEYEEKKRYNNIKLENEEKISRKYKNENIQLKSDIDIIVRKYKKIKRILIKNKINII